MIRFFTGSFFLPLGALISGALLAGSFPPLNQAWLIWIALIPVLFALHVMPPSCSYLYIFRSGYVLGLVYFGGCFWWLGLVTIPGALALVAYISVYPALWLCWSAWIWRREIPYTSGQTLLIALELANAWILLEALRGWLFTGFGWDSLGVALHNNIPLIQGARLGGVLLLSWVIVLLNVIGVLTIIRFYHEIRRDQVMLAHLDFNAAMLLLALLFAYGLTMLLQSRREPMQELRYAMVQPNIEQSLSHPMNPAEVFDRFERLSRIAATSRPQLLMWPESTVGTGVETDPQFNYVAKTVRQMGNFSFLLGSEHQVDDRYYNSAFFLRPQAGNPEIYEKIRLVAFGEYTPFAEQIPFLHRLMPFDTDFSPGTESKIFVLPDCGLKLSPLICFEDTLPDLARQVAALQPDLLVNLTNDGWFQNSPGAEHHLINAVLTAVSTNLPLLRCANTGITAAINSDGEIAPGQQLTYQNKRIGVEGVLCRTLKWPPHHQTLFQIWGHWVVWLALLINFRRRLPDLIRWGRRWGHHLGSKQKRVG